MYYEIYADSLFLLQFFMNMYLLGLVNHMLFHTASGKRIAAGAAIGAVCSMLPFFLPIKLLVSMVVSFFLSMISMSLFTFRTFQGKQLMQVLQKMLMGTLLLGGLLLFLLKLLPEGNGSYLGLIAVLAVGAVCYIIVRKMTEKKTERSHMCKVTLENGTVSIQVDALVDTGNSLIEPISGKPVAVLEEGAFQDLFGDMENLGYRAIPYHSVGKANGILQGYLLQKMIIELQGVKKECRNVYIAMGQELIPEKDTYRMILNPQVLEEV